MFDEFNKALKSSANKHQISWRSIHVASLLHVFLEKIFYLNSVLGNLILDSIVFYTIIEHQLNVVYKLLHVLVHIESQLFLYRPKIHRLVDYVKVVVNAVLTRVHWLVEVVPSLWFPTNWKHLLSHFHPTLLGLDLLNARSIDFFRVLQNDFKVRKIQ